MALLAIVLPLITTIVAFYYGQRAGAGAGEAEKQKTLAEVATRLGAQQTDTDKVNELQEWIKKNTG